MTTSDKVVDLLNSLIQINEDRKEGYQKAWEHSDDLNLKTLFDQYSKQSGRYIVELGTAVESYGGVPAERTSISGDAYRAWMDIKDALTTNQRKTVLASCERGEDAAVSTYKDALEDSQELDNNLVGVITMQYRDIEKAHDQIKTLRDSA
ncbi:PA2169 family four-helix-bundle protein [Arachidicoccus ginsenosidivorans]|jgi:uncharacterized protein (TIGR02284 family)|uniref:PA2169 family four-helix-bundle protein n=1 Tax=Arachidicoccus ginsenosidivorans TaxID=496057 RepID=A0A5B8VU07_9BACT|nr:PA2169 family four-helix-bundle protein [Arachidicoccus ginsenosidivorans]QEC73628.1 PA2169 family four-helix-bundle protein [Arachidicoccus ginsenosidivorans]